MRACSICLSVTVLATMFEFGLLDLQRGGVGDSKKDLALVPELGETSLGSLGLGVEGFGDAADLGLHSSVDNDNSSSTFGDLRS